MKSLRKRSLSKKFIQALEERDAVPKLSAVESWLRTNDSIKTGYIGRLFRGEALRSEVATKFVRYVLAMGEKDRANHTYLVLRDYVRSIAHADLEELSPHVIAYHLLEEEDALRWGLDDFAGLFQSPLSFVEAARVCKPHKLFDAIQWMYVGAGRLTKPDASPSEAIEIAEARIGISYEEFTARATNWHRFDPWTTILAYAHQEPVGMSTVLPLSKEAYEAVRDGRRVPHELSRRDLQRPSPYIFLEGLAERPVECGGPDSNMTVAQHMACLRQVAVLTHRTGPDAQIPIHALSFAPAEIVETRLISNGFSKLPAMVKDSNLPLYEHILCSDIRQTKVYMFLGLLWFMGRDADSAISPAGVERADFSRPMEDGF